LEIYFNEKAMTINFLIAVEDLKQLGLINENVDTKIIKYTIQTVQDMNVQTATGTPLYKELLRRVEDNDWNAAYTKLMEEYIAMVIVSHCNVRIVGHLNNKITNKATGAVSDENLQANAAQANNSYKSQLRKDADFYTERLIGYLKDNDELYPEYKDNECKHENVKKSKGGFNTWVKV
jgi:hypothetical protein